MQCLEHISLMLTAGFTHTYADGCQFLDEIFNMLPPVCAHSFLETPLPCILFHSFFHNFLLKVVDDVVFFCYGLLRNIILFQLGANFGVFGVNFVLNFEKR